MFEYFFETRSGEPVPTEGDVSAKSVVVQHTICKDFFTKFDDNACVNINVGADFGQWCYVDSSCSNLNGGASVATWPITSWKKCVPSGDKMLRQLAPDQLVELSRTHDLDLSFLHKMSYPLWEGGLWSHARPVWLGPMETQTKPPVLSSVDFTELKYMLNNCEPVSFDTLESHNPPHKIVLGDKLYTVLKNAKGNAKHPSTWYTLQSQLARDFNASRSPCVTEA